jgi:hypothetical protein
LDCGDLRGFAPWESFVSHVIDHPDPGCGAQLRVALRARDDAIRIAAKLWGQSAVDRIDRFCVALLPKAANSKRLQLAFAFRTLPDADSDSAAICCISTQPLACPECAFFIARPESISAFYPEKRGI